MKTTNDHTRRDCLRSVPGAAALLSSRLPTAGPPLGSLKITKHRAYKSARGSEGSVLRVKARSKTRWREGTLLWSRRRGGKREGMPETSDNLDVRARQLWCPAIGVRQVRPRLVGFGEGRDGRSDAPVNGRIATGVGLHARHIKKSIKLCAGKPHAQFERGLMEMGRR
jgi:hypothetical protein